MDEIIQETDGKSDGESSKGKRARAVKVKLAAVKVVHTEGEAALVQWAERGKLKRGIVPAASVEDDQVAASELEACLPYGDDFSKVKGITAGVVKALKENGVWTKADAMANPRRVHEALMIGYVPTTADAIIEFSKEE